MTALFTHSKPVIGVIHVGALPGTPRGEKSVAELVSQAQAEARVYTVTRAYSRNTVALLKQLCESHSAKLN